jgi:predicted metal-dependent enzyme (double-stranded beta helix superfamily)
MDALDQLIEDCRSALSGGQPASQTGSQSAVAECVGAALADPERFAAAVHARPKPWFFVADDDLTVFCTEGRPGNASAPHDHGTWSVIGCYEGSEESWWHEPVANGLQQVGTGVLRAGEVSSLGADVIHAVMNRWIAPNGVIHIYGGNFLAKERFIWDPVTGERYVAGLTEPLAPHALLTAHDTGATHPEASNLGGTMFAALSVRDVRRVSSWLSEALGLTQLANQDDTCALDEQFSYLIDPASLTIVGVHAYDTASAPSERAGLDHLALRVPTIEGLESWRRKLTERGLKPTSITPWQFGSFVDVVGPERLTIRLFVPTLKS